MSFSQEWDERYRANTHLSIWPWSDLVSYVMRYARPYDSGFRVLELGCGAGANIPFFLQLQVDYYAIEGSPAIVEQIIERFPQLKDRIDTKDFTREIPFEGAFDLIVDRASLTHNSTKAIEKCLELVYSHLKPGGKYIGIDWFSTLHSDYQGGGTIDTYTRKDYKTGQFAGIGNVHFSDKEHLLQLFNKFQITLLEHKVIQRMISTDEYQFASWNFVAQKGI